jgi:hypothetical protein
MIEMLKRVQNMVYTTSDKYDVNVKMSGVNSYTDTENVTIATVEALQKVGLTEQEAMNVVMYSAGHEGAHVKFSDIGDFRAILKKAHEEGADLKLLNNMIQVAEDYRVDTTMRRERPGYWDIRTGCTDASGKMFRDAPSGDSTEDFGKALSFVTYDQDLRDFGWEGKVTFDWGMVENVAKDLMDIAEESKTSGQLIRKVYEYYGKTFKKEDDEEEEGEYETRKANQEASKTGRSGGKRKKADDVNDTTGSSGCSVEVDASSDSGEDGESGEDDPGEGHSKSVERDKDVEAKDGVGDGFDGYAPDPEDVSKDTGDGDASFEEMIKKMEEALAGKKSAIDDLVGSEAGKDLDKLKKESFYKAEGLKKHTDASKDLLKDWVSSGRYKSVWSDEERKRIQDKLCTGVHAGADILYASQDLGHIKPFNPEDVSVLARHARQMGSKLAELLKEDTNDRGFVSNSGSKMIANRVWKPVHTGGADVFFKKGFTEEGGYVIDLVLDASGSQGRRVNDIRKQAFVIAEACSVAGIPCRVTQFRNSRSFTILELIRDFDDQQRSNLNCGTFYADGDNRDGLAIMLANVELQKRTEPNKIMIVLSDGSPYDVSGFHKIKAFGGMSRYAPYRDKPGSGEAVIDLCNVVRDIRKSGTALMGVYVGSGDYTLDIEKTVYGKDFAYVGNNMNNFVPIIMKYLVKHIQGFDR